MSVINLLFVVLALLFGWTTIAKVQCRKVQVYDDYGMKQ